MRSIWPYILIMLLCGPARAAAVITHYEYDAAGQITQTVDGIAKTIASQFLASGDRSQLTYPADLNLALAFTYDNLGQATRIDRNGQQLAAYLYAGRTLTQRDITTASTTATHVTYNVGLDAHRRQAQLRNTASVGAASSLLDQYNYTYDANGNRQSAAVTGDPRLDPNTTYGYDALDRVISADYGTGHGTESFNYDLLGNRQASPAGYTDRQGRTTAYTHNSVNEYQTVTPSVQNPVHDGGNLTQTENGYRLEYDYENRLVTVRDKDAGHTTLATYTYDALGHRVKQVKGPQTTRYYYDGETVLAEYDSTNTLQRYHIHGPAYVDEHLVLNQASQEYYYLLTSLYSVSGLADASGKVVERYRYDTYGAATWFPPALTTRDFLRFQAAFSGDQPCSEAARVFDYTGDGKVNLADYRTCFTGGPGTAPGTAAALSPYRFTGQPLDFHLTDPATGRPTLVLYHYRARAYDAYNGRFCQRDPELYADSMSLYEYVSSRPATLMDSSGKAAEWALPDPGTTMAWLANAAEAVSVWGYTTCVAAQAEAYTLGVTLWITAASATNPVGQVDPSVYSKLADDIARFTSGDSSSGGEQPQWQQNFNNYANGNNGKGPDWDKWQHIRKHVEDFFGSSSLTSGQLREFDGWINYAMKSKPFTFNMQGEGEVFVRLTRLPDGSGRWFAVIVNKAGDFVTAYTPSGSTLRDMLNAMRGL